MRKFTVDRMVRLSATHSEVVDFTIEAVNGPDAAKLADDAKAAIEVSRGLVASRPSVPPRLGYSPTFAVKDARIS
jgi:hypothetical protein